MKAQQLTPETVPILDLKPYPGNPRRGDLAAIRESLEHNGQYRPIVVRRADQSRCWPAITRSRPPRSSAGPRSPVTYVDCDAEQAKRIVLADNRTNDLAGYDNQALAELLTELPDLAGTGYDQAALDSLLDELEPEPLVEEEVPPPPAEPRTRPGDLYELGPHRLLCGDARDPGAYARLLGDERAELLWTDPPYGVDYEGKTKAKLRIANDRAGDLRGAARRVLRRSRRAPSPTAPPSTSPPPAGRCSSPSPRRSSTPAGSCARPWSGSRTRSSSATPTTTTATSSSSTASSRGRGGSAAAGSAGTATTRRRACSSSTAPGPRASTRR